MQPGNPFFGLFLKYRIYRTNFSLSIIVCAALIVYLVTLSIVMLTMGRGLFAYTASMNEDCARGACRFVIRVRKPVPLPVVVYVGFENFHFNHRKVLQSISMEQLSPDGDAAGDTHTCAGYRTNADGARFYPQIFGDLAPEDELKPCGLRPLLYRNCELKRQRDHYARAWS